MALMRQYSSPCFSTVSNRVTSNNKSLIKAAMLLPNPTARCHTQAQPTKKIKTFNSSFSATASTSTKIYEDKSMGIVGYKDETGEVIYEGLDEGPRLTHEDLEQISTEREASNREHVHKLLFEILQADNCYENNVTLPEGNQNMKLK